MNTIFCKDNYFLLIIDCKKAIVLPLSISTALVMVIIKLTIYELNVSRRLTYE